MLWIFFTAMVEDLCLIASKNSYGRGIANQGWMNSYKMCIFTSISFRMELPLWNTLISYLAQFKLKVQCQNLNIMFILKSFVSFRVLSSSTFFFVCLGNRPTFDANFGVVRWPSSVQMNKTPNTFFPYFGSKILK
jgi:hypothetical protein